MRQVLQCTLHKMAQMESQSRLYSSSHKNNLMEPQSYIFQLRFMNVLGLLCKIDLSYAHLGFQGLYKVVKLF